MPLLHGDFRYSKTLRNRKETAYLRQKKTPQTVIKTICKVFKYYGPGLFHFALFSENSTALGQIKVIL